MLTVRVFLVAVLVAAAAAFETEDFVIVGTDANFDEVVAAHDYLLVEFCK